LRYGIRDVRFPKVSEERTIDTSSPALVRDPGKCILCGDCVRVCAEKQGGGVLDFMHRGAQLTVAPAFEKPLAESGCTSCGQCAAVCPTGAITVRSHKDQVYRVLDKPGTRMIAQIAPAVRVALGEEFGESSGENVMGRLVAGLRHLGFAEVYDTSAGADLTVLEEAEELLARLKQGKNLPLFTSCCPAWVEAMHKRYPEMAGICRAANHRCPCWERSSKPTTKAPRPLMASRPSSLQSCLAPLKRLKRRGKSWPPMRAAMSILS
jgi:NADH-quinone oxidoreductase subunit G